MEISSTFPRYTDFDPRVPVWYVTPGLPGCWHRFFDTSPISPSGRYLAVTRFEHEDRMPGPAEAAEIVLVDLETGEAQTVAESRGWDTQLGAQVQWGRDDTQLFFNDMDTERWRPFGVVLNPLTGARRSLEGTVYMVSPDGKRVASPCLLRTGLTQAGYGVLAPSAHVPLNEGVSDTDGVYMTDVDTGACRLLVSFRQIVDAVGPTLACDPLLDGDLYGFHVKWNAQSDRLQFVVRWKPHDGTRMRHNLITFAADGTDIQVAIPASEWADKGGHHPNWCPDGENVMMNLNIVGEGLRLVRARYDGTGLAPMTDAVVGSGHPSLHPNGRHVVTDTYLKEPMAFGDGTTPIRWIDVAEGRQETLVRMRTQPDFAGPKGERRVDPHPAWDYQFRRIAFNGCPDGVRGVFVADVIELL